MGAIPVEQIHVATALVYIAGVEVPVSDVSVSFGVNQIPQAVISMPADEELYRLGEEDKVPVAIFYLDQWYSEDGKAKNIDPTFRLLFDGEITGWEYTESVDGDAISFTATSHALTLGQMFAKFLTGDILEVMRNNMNTLGTDQGILTDLMTKTFPYCLFKKGIFTGSFAEDIERPYDFVENLLLPMKIGGYPKNGKVVQADGSYTKAFLDKVYEAEIKEVITASHFYDFITESPPQSASMNFFVSYCHKTKFDRRWIATSLEKFLEADVFGEFNKITDQRFKPILDELSFRAIGNMMQNNLGVGDSFWNILMQMYSAFVYEILCLPTASYGKVSLNKQTRGIPISKNEAGHISEYRLGNYISKPVCYFTIAPECNIIFPSMSSTRRHEENYATQPTRSISGSPFLDLYLRTNKALGDDPIAVQATTVGYPDAVDVHIRNKSIVNPGEILLYPEEYFKGPVVQHNTAPVWYNNVKETWSNKALELQKTNDALNKKVATGQQKNTLSTTSPKEPNDAELAQMASSISRESRELYHRYNQMKHFEARYSMRRGSESLAFNPYLVPGYTFVRFAKEGKTLHTMGMIETVNIRISSAGSSTSVSYGFGRTLKEVYEEAIQSLLNDISNKKAFKFFAMYPLDPSLTISTLLQEEVAAAEYFKSIFYLGTPDSKAGIFKIKDYLKTTEYRGFTIPTSKPVSSDTRKGYEVVVEPKPEVSSLMHDYHEAMRKVARPICTLAQYTEFINGGLNADFAETEMLPADVYGVKVPVYIKYYNTDSSLDHYIKPTTNTTGLVDTENLPELRRDWVSRLERYRTKIYNKEIQT